VSRGLGIVQRYIRDQVTRRRELISLVVLAKYYAEDNGRRDTRYLRSSFRRAAAGLVKSGELKGWELQCPTRRYADGSMGSYRSIFCVAPVDMAITEKDEHGARVSMALIGAR
jgi:hypothetical protein